MMLQADGAKVEWDPAKNLWHVQIQFGEEVIKRSLPKKLADTGEEALRSLAVQTAKDEGYQLDQGRVTIVR